MGFDLVCWLRFMRRVFDALGSFEPNKLRRKTLAIEVLKRIESEEGHNVENIGKELDKGGNAGIIRRAKEITGKKGEEEPNPVLKRKKKKVIVESEVI